MLGWGMLVQNAGGFDEGGGAASRGRCGRFEDGGRVAQLVEQCPFKAWVAGSSPAALTNATSLLPCATSDCSPSGKANLRYEQELCQ